MQLYYLRLKTVDKIIITILGGVGVRVTTLQECGNKRNIQLRIGDLYAFFTYALFDFSITGISNCSKQPYTKNVPGPSRRAAIWSDTSQLASLLQLQIKR